MRTELLRMSWKVVAGLVLVPALAVLGCGGGGGGMEAEPEMAAEPMEEEAPAPSGPPRVFFVAPLDGDQISSDHDVELEFGAENYMISAIPEGFDPEGDEPRADMGHYHLGVDTGCLPAGEIIPEGQGWVHFGDGSNVFTPAGRACGLRADAADWRRPARYAGRSLRDHQHRDCGRHLGRSVWRRFGVSGRGGGKGARAGRGGSKE